MKNEMVFVILENITCGCAIVEGIHHECLRCLVTREVQMLVQERDRLQRSLATYEAELARVERELSAKNI